jgi:glycosyltransferase involved in cell wall biosynthesis
MDRHWTINGRFLTQRLTGVQRYGREIVCALDILVRDGHPLTRGLKLEVLVPKSWEGALELFSVPIRRVGRLQGHLWEQVSLPLHARGGVLSLCNTSTVIRRRQVVCIHDVNFIEFPASYSRNFRLLYRALLPKIAGKAAVVTTVSQYSRQRLAQHRIADAEKIIVMPNGHEHVLEWTPRASEACSALGRNTVLMIGSLAPHKNLALAIALARDLAQHGIRVAVAGSLDCKVFANLAGETHGNVMWLGRLSDDELAAALAKCLCLVFPSFVEGFGLPPLEAMARGCPVIASNRASLPEVCGSGVLYASPDQPQEWLQAVLSLRSNPVLRADLIRRGTRQAANYSWFKSAELYLEVMARTDGQFR